MDLFIVCLEIKATVLQFNHLYLKPLVFVLKTNNYLATFLSSFHLQRWNIFPQVVAFILFFWKYKTPVFHPVCTRVSSPQNKGCCTVFPDGGCREGDSCCEQLMFVSLQLPSDFCIGYPVESYWPTQLLALLLELPCSKVSGKPKFSWCTHFGQSRPVYCQAGCQWKIVGYAMNRLIC